MSFNAFNLYDPFNKHVDVEGEHYKLVREIGRAGAVLLKNTDAALPLKAPRNLVLVGACISSAYFSPVLSNICSLDMGQVRTRVMALWARTASPTAVATMVSSVWAGAPAR